MKEHHQQIRYGLRDKSVVSGHSFSENIASKSWTPKFSPLNPDAWTRN